MYQIGEFSKICQVSVKTLRYYDRIGILKPVEVDAVTGYRYYTREQLERMLLIQKLKRYGFSLEDIQPLLSCDTATLCGELRRQRETLQRRQMELEMILQELTAHLHHLERTHENMELTNGYEISLKQTQPLAVFACRQQMGVQDFGRYFSTLYERLARDGATPTATGAIYHDKEFDRDSSDIELFVGVKEEERADKVMEPTLCAATVHKGGYSTLNEAYAALVSWIEENGYQWGGAPFEIYTKAAWNGLKPEDWETEIYFPIRKEET